MRYILNYLVLLFLCFSGFGQTPIPESGFENWTQTASYEEPTGNWWTSLNTLKSLGGPITLSKTTDIHSGNYAAKLETKKWGTLIIPGLLVSGRFVTAAPFIIQGKPFTDKPIKFKGYYKYISVNNDSAALFAMITKYNSSTLKRDTIAFAQKAILTTTNTYTAFDINFVYSSSSAPDSIDIVFSSSAAGANFAGQVGSTLFVDDIMLEYNSGIVESLTPEVAITIFPIPAKLSFEVEINTSHHYPLYYFIYSIDGKLASKGNIENNKTYISTHLMNAGNYILNVYTEDVLLGSKKFIIE
ncbi:MAG: PCMD domain-containing protein [Bacteroidales bacterium]